MGTIVSDKINGQQFFAFRKRLIEELGDQYFERIALVEEQIKEVMDAQSKANPLEAADLITLLINVEQPVETDEREAIKAMVVVAAFEMMGEDFIDEMKKECGYAD